MGVGFDDVVYIVVGVEIVLMVGDVFVVVDMIVKVKEL